LGLLGYFHAWGSLNSSLGPKVFERCTERLERGFDDSPEKHEHAVKAFDNFVSAD
jgi:hypothetical protein